MIENHTALFNYKAAEFSRKELQNEFLRRLSDENDENLISEKVQLKLQFYYIRRKMASFDMFSL